MGLRSLVIGMILMNCLGSLNLKEGPIGHGDTVFTETNHPSDNHTDDENDPYHRCHLGHCSFPLAPAMDFNLRPIPSVFLKIYVQTTAPLHQILSGLWRPPRKIS